VRGLDGGVFGRGAGATPEPVDRWAIADRTASTSSVESRDDRSRPDWRDTAAMTYSPGARPKDAKRAAIVGLHELAGARTRDRLVARVHGRDANSRCGRATLVGGRAAQHGAAAHAKLDRERSPAASACDTPGRPGRFAPNAVVR
jgi:hypothetical protein